MALGANLALTVPLAAILNVWQDEAYTLQTTSRGAGYAFHQAIGFEQNAPLYFVVMALWRHAGDGIFFLRLFSVLCIAATVLLIPGLARRYVPQVDGVLVAAVVACNPFVVWAAVELRVYALIVLMSALLLRTFFDAFVEENPSRWAAIAYAVCVGLALYTQYYLAFLVAAQAATLLFYNRRALPAFVLAGGAAALAFVPMLAIVPGQVQNFKSIFAPPSIVQTCINLAGIGLRYLLPLPLLHAKNAYVVCVVVALLALTFARPSLKAVGRSPIVAMTGFAFAFFAAGTYLSGVHVLDRHAASLYVPVTLAIFAVLTTARFANRRRAVLLWSALVMALSLFTLVWTYRHLAKPGDWARAAAYRSSPRTSRRNHRRVRGRECPAAGLLLRGAEPDRSDPPRGRFPWLRHSSVRHPRPGGTSGDAAGSRADLARNVRRLCLRKRTVRLPPTRGFHRPPVSGRVRRAVFRDPDSPDPRGCTAVPGVPRTKSPLKIRPLTLGYLPN